MKPSDKYRVCAHLPKELLTWGTVEVIGRMDARYAVPVFGREPEYPCFYLDVDWVDPAWPKGVQVFWEDDEPGLAYYMRVEQVDGNIAWSGPIWSLDELPCDHILGRVAVSK